MYDKNNVFAKILRGELPCNKIYEDEQVLCFYDIHPKARIHALVLPKKPFIDFEDFMRNAGVEEVSYLFKKVEHIASEVLGLSGNFQVHINNGSGAGQVVFHFHIHILSNKA